MPLRFNPTPPAPDPRNRRHRPGNHPVGTQELSRAGRRPSGFKPLAEFLETAAFLASLAHVRPGQDPLAEDWAWVRVQMGALLQLTEEFAQTFTETKRELGMVDFHDLEQYALRLLWDSAVNQPTRIAQQWRQHLRFIFVDEYQDINAAQDKIIEALSRPDGQANRFLVGDVKQSIYRFRLANPHIFQRYIHQWNQETGQGLAIPLVDKLPQPRRHPGLHQLPFPGSHASGTGRGSLTTKTPA